MMVFFVTDWVKICLGNVEFFLQFPSFIGFSEEKIEEILRKMGDFW
jgi:hypothetical protein